MGHVGEVPRRVSLVVPGSAPEKLAKAAQRGADEVVIDLEDAVGPAAKERARAAVGAALVELDWGETMLAVRVNARGTPWWEADLAALAGASGRLCSVVLPKVERAEDVLAAAHVLDAASGESTSSRARPGTLTREPLRLQALIETAAGVARVQEIAGASPRLETLILGYADLAASLGRTAAGAAEPASWDTIRELVLLAARAHGLQLIDGPWFGLRPDDAFAAAACRARDAGCDGKWAIHPAQVEPLRALFTPGRAEVAHARKVVDALAAAERDGRGAAALDGQMIDEPIRLAALRVLARAGAP